MTRDVTYCSPTDALEDVLMMMKERGLVHIPIVERSSRPSGVIDAQDTLRALMEQADYKVSLLRDYIIMGVGYR
jgi:CBS domain-containing protein